MAWIVAGIGLFSMCGALFNWGWFMSSRKAQSMARLVGPNGARLFYGVLGAVLVVLGALMAGGVIAQPS